HLKHPYLMNDQAQLFARCQIPCQQALIHIEGLSRQAFTKRPQEFRPLLLQAVELKKQYHQMKLHKFQPLQKIQIDPVLGYILHLRKGSVYLGLDQFRSRLLRVHKTMGYLRKKGFSSFHYIFANQKHHPERLTLRLYEPLALQQKTANREVP
ncbi:MAG: hypothetical protein AAGJ35_07240, partial [Myxococcota bacterium]